MEEFLRQLMGKKIDVSCGEGTSVRGEVVDVKDGILYLRDEEKTAYVAVEKIAVGYGDKFALFAGGAAAF